MRILLIDHGRCDPPATRGPLLRAALEPLGARATVCGPSSVPSLMAQPDGMFGIHLRDIAAASRKLLAAVEAGSADALLAALPAVSPRLLGLVREAARQCIAEAVDATNPDVLFVFHAGILADLAIETGVPVALHVTQHDLAAAGKGSVRDLVSAAIGSCDGVIGDSPVTIETIRHDWTDDAALATDSWPADEGCAARLLAACHEALARRNAGGENRGGARR
jgi:hypothetical protein